jgi:hypothetical protein
VSRKRNRQFRQRVQGLPSSAQALTAAPLTNIPPPAPGAAAPAIPLHAGTGTIGWVTDSKTRRTNNIVATKALAHKLVRASYHILKEG